MNVELPSEIQSTVFKYPIWGILWREKKNSLLVDCRDEDRKRIEVFELDLKSKKSKRLTLSVSWFEKLVGVSNDHLYSIEYKDINDPSSFLMKTTNLLTGAVVHIDQLPSLNMHIKEPSLYEFETHHHKTISKFLSVDLSLSCEYYEEEGIIIISYYLRSDQGFDRFLLVINEGEKRWKVLQDRRMKGFSSGAFFVIGCQLIFVRDRNEICVYNW